MVENYFESLLNFYVSVLYNFLTLDHENLYFNLKIIRSFILVQNEDNKTKTFKKMSEIFHEF